MASSFNSGGAFDTILPSASTFVASSSATKLMPYDVFINHCGQDVKHTLASRIYNSLNDTGLRVFLDKDELKLGDLLPKALEEAMASASIYIAIFSEHYARSPWCLAELVFMVKTRKKIIPVFYHVEPSELRWTGGGKGKYADAFSEHEKKDRYTAEVLQGWKQALQEVSCCIGGIINNIEDEQRVVKNVVNRVMEEMKVVPLEVAKHPVGLDKAVQDFDMIARQLAGPIQIIGIWGMGGAGKTTLATELYNRKRWTKDKSSFLFDLRDAAVKGLLHKKQKRLLKDLDFKDDDKKDDFDNVNAGKQILKSRLRSVRVLIVLDDVDHTEQLEALLPAKETLGQGSLIIVTTREKNVLTSWGISTIYKMTALEASHAKQLFCWHAFLQSSPLSGFEDLVEKFLTACHGLPLSLKVLGGQLYGRSDKDYWQLTFNKFSRIPHKDINERLKVSYDVLNDEEKEMFLDTACFFLGQRKSVAIAVWDASEWDGLLGWETLFNKCLVEVGEDGFIRMHDHLRDLGRDIAKRQSPYRLWSPQQIIQISPQQVAIPIRGMANAIGDNCDPRQEEIVIHTNQGERSLAPRSLGLKIFVGNGNFFSQTHSELSRELIWLQCNPFEHKILPSLSESTSLKIFELYECHKLKKIEGLGNLRSLETLRIHDCPELDGLPSLSELTSLKEFDLQKCYKLEKIEGLGNLRSLETLWIDVCPELDGLPSLSELTSLKKFDLQKCHKLEKIEGLGNLRSLETLRIHDCPELDGLPSLSELTSLKKFTLKCHKLEKIEGLGNLRSLETLRIHDCPELDGLPSLSELTSLKEFVLLECHKLEKIEGIERLRSLQLLEVHTRWNAPCIVSLEQCERLERLVVVANDRSAVDPFISNIQKWPRHVIICTRAVFDVGSLKNSFEGLPNVSVLHYSEVEVGEVQDTQWLELRRPESSANANAILICFIIDCFYTDSKVFLSSSLSYDDESFTTEMGEGKWVWMGVFTQASDWLESKQDYIESSRGRVEVEEAWLVKGEEGSIVEAFHSHFRCNGGACNGGAL